MSDTGFPLEKIPNPGLRRHAAEDSDEQVSVLIELDLPQWRVELDKVSRGGVTIYLPRAVEPEPSDGQESVERRVSEASAFLEELLGTTPRWLRTARSFVARVTPEQLRTIARSPLIKAIWPNRRVSAFTSPGAA